MASAEIGIQDVLIVHGRDVSKFPSPRISALLVTGVRIKEGKNMLTITCLGAQVTHYWYIPEIV